MQVRKGIAVSPGVAICEALVVDNEGFRIPRRRIAPSAVDVEIARLDDALNAVGQEIADRRDAVTSKLGAQYGAIFSAHLQMVADPQLVTALRDLVCNDHSSAEYAVSRTLREYAQVFERLDNHYMAERAHDIYDIEKLLLTNLLGERREDLGHLAAPAIVFAHRLTPSETANLNREFVKAFVTEIGGAGGHAAIVAEALEIPAVVGLGSFLGDVSTGDLVIVDGDHGGVVFQPDDETLQHYQQEKVHQDARFQWLSGLRELPAETRDGQRIQLSANIEFPQEVDVCLERGSDGIGLFRTEFLYLSRTGAAPSEEDQFAAYSRVVNVMGESPVIIRTQDLGADKQPDDATNAERNPVLGLRSIRLSLRDVGPFRTQLRAILRASSAGNVWLMFPMIATRGELLQAREILADVMDELEREGVEFNRVIPVGIMVEVPSVVITLEHFVDEIDFISIGTNDLTQYALAVDRGNKDVADLYNASDPAVLRFIQISIQSAQHAGIHAGLCGQMSANPIFTQLLIGMGLRSISVPPYVLPEIKQVCRSVTVQQCERVAEMALTMNSPQDINRFLEEELKKVAPELVV
jgi:phosphotransferase system enzyme I (PtsI)